MASGSRRPQRDAPAESRPSLLPALLRPLWVGVGAVAVVAMILNAAGFGPAAIAWTVLGVADLALLAVFAAVRSTQTFAMATMAGALVRLPIAFAISLWLGASVDGSLPLAFLGSSLASAIVAGVAIRRHERAARSNADASQSLAHA